MSHPRMDLTLKNSDISWKNSALLGFPNSYEFLCLNDDTDGTVCSQNFQYMERFEGAHF